MTDPPLQLSCQNGFSRLGPVEMIVYIDTPSVWVIIATKCYEEMELYLSVRRGTEMPLSGVPYSLILSAPVPTLATPIKIYQTAVVLSLES